MFYTEIKRQAKNGKKTFSQYKPGLCIVLTMLVKKQITFSNSSEFWIPGLNKHKFGNFAFLFTPLVTP